MLDNPPPPSSDNIAMILNQSDLDQSLEVMIEIVSINIQRLLQLHSAHLISLRKCLVCTLSRWMGQCCDQRVCPYSAHRLTNLDSTLLRFEDILSRSHLAKLFSACFKSDTCRFPHGDEGFLDQCEGASPFSQPCPIENHQNHRQFMHENTDP